MLHKHNCFYTCITHSHGGLILFINVFKDISLYSIAILYYAIKYSLTVLWILITAIVANKYIKYIEFLSVFITVYNYIIVCFNVFICCL